MPSRMDPPDGKIYTIARKSLPPEPSWNRNRLDQLPSYGHRKRQQVQREAHPSVCRLFEIMLVLRRCGVDDEIESRGRRCHAFKFPCMYDTHTTSPSFPLPLTTHTTPCGDVFMSLQGAPDAPFGFIWGLPVATKAPILMILSKVESTTPHALSMIYLQRPSLSNHVSYTFLDSVCVRSTEAHPVFLISSSRRDTTLHVRCPNFNYKNGVRGVLYMYVHSLSCLALYRPSQPLLSLLYEVLARLLSADRFAVP